MTPVLIASIAILQLATSAPGLPAPSRSDRPIGAESVEPTQATTATVSLIDRRPTEESKTKRLSMFVTSCDYDILRMNDRDLTPNRIDRLADIVQQKLGNRLSGKVIYVDHYVVYFNAGQYYRGGVSSHYSNGVIPQLMLGMASNCPREKTTGGWYDSSEVTGPASPFVIDITVSIDQKSYSIHKVYTPDRQLYVSNSARANDAKVLGEALDAASAGLASKIATEFP